MNGIYVITLAKRFPAYHIRKGQPTNFSTKFENGDKIHTIRGNYEAWKKKVDKVNSGLFHLSIREWSDKPYNSIQVKLGIRQKLNIQKCSVTIIDGIPIVFIDGVLVSDETLNLLIKNDGLSKSDFLSWFKNPIVDGAIIHFTDFRYDN